ncbi:hypothetical protein B0H17DRAFT_1186106 [Mycena rosella]|uniref:Uncharacterized protein n=1 Tax=Mycena rosella TaxID=1033263 RepID=A0AAD7CR25_MYCRO|nr:hypothetical protein B0H17DRAFT_1186106 [Mycena rosella]
MEEEGGADFVRGLESKGQCPKLSLSVVYPSSSESSSDPSGSGSPSLSASPVTDVEPDLYQLEKFLPRDWPSSSDIRSHWPPREVNPSRVSSNAATRSDAVRLKESAVRPRPRRSSQDFGLLHWMENGSEAPPPSSNVAKDSRQACGKNRIPPQQPDRLLRIKTWRHMKHIHDLKHRSVTLENYTYSGGMGRAQGVFPREACGSPRRVDTFQQSRDDLARRARRPQLLAPISVYLAHPGSSISYMLSTHNMEGPLGT